MNAADQQIAEILGRFDEPFANAVWRVQSTLVIYHKALERIAAKANIAYDPPTIVRKERDEAVILVTGRMGERAEWSIGEALIGVNYRISGKQAAYVYAMAEKRAKDRVILKLIGLHGLLYSEEEADEFKDGRPSGEGAREERRPVQAKAAATTAANDGSDAALRARIDRAKTINAVTDLMLDPETQKALSALPEKARDEVRDHAKARLIALGWGKKSGAREAKTQGERPAARPPMAETATRPRS